MLNFLFYKDKAEHIKCYISIFSFLLYKVKFSNGILSVINNHDVTKLYITY